MRKQIWHPDKWLLLLNPPVHQWISIVHCIKHPNLLHKTTQARGVFLGVKDFFIRSFDHAINHPNIPGQNCAFIWWTLLITDEAVAVYALDIPSKYICPAFIT